MKSMKNKPRLWKKCKPETIRKVNFALGSANVRLLSYFDYRFTGYYAKKSVNGRVYHVEDVITGHQDMVGIEYLKKIT